MTHTTYHPEMGDQPRPTALFASRSCLSKVSICWAADRDSEARQVFKQLRIRPSNIRPRNAGEWSLLRGRDGFSALVTYAADEKLCSSSDIDVELLLD